MIMLKKIKDRKRLSIDLEAYQDVKSMLEDAVNATGNTQTEIVIQSLREHLHKVVLKIRNNADAFLKKYK